MSSEFLIAVPHELRQDNLMSIGREGKIFDVNYANSHLEPENSLTVPGFSCIKNFPFSQKMKFTDIPVPIHAAAKRHLLDDNLEMSVPKLIKLQSEFTNYHPEAAVDMVDTVKSQIIKNDVIFGEVLENHAVNNSGKKDASVEESSLQHLAQEVLDTTNTDHILVEAMDGNDCPAVEQKEDGTTSERKSSDQQQSFSKTETENALLEMQAVHEVATSLGTDQDCITESENLMLHSEKRVYFAHEFVGAEANDYHNPHESFSLSEFLIYPTGFEQKVSCDELLQSVQKEGACESNVTVALDASTGKERMDSNVMFHCGSEISGHASTSFASDNKLNRKDVGGNASTTPLCETQKLLHSLEEANSTDSLQNKGTFNVEVTHDQAMVKEEIAIKEEVEEPIQHSIQVDDYLADPHYAPDLVDWFMSLVDQDTVLENVSTSPYGHHVGTGHTEDLCDSTAHKENLTSVLLEKTTAVKEYAMERETVNGNELADKDLPSHDVADKLECVKVADNYTKNSTDSCFNNRFLQNLFSDVADIHPIQKTEASFEKEQNAHKEFLLTGLSMHTLSQIPNTDMKSLENKPDSDATSDPDADNNHARLGSDTVCKHHKKEIIKKFSSEFSNGGKYDTLRLPQENRTQVATTVKNSDCPSTSAAVTSEDKCVKDCIVISDSDDSSIEFDIVKCNIKKRHTKSTLSGSSGKNIQLNSRKCSRNARPPANENLLGQLVRNSTIKSNVIHDCIVLSDSDDELSKSELPLRKIGTNLPDQPADIPDAKSLVSGSNESPRNRIESLGVMDLSGGRTPSAVSKGDSFGLSGVDSNGGAFANAFATGDSLCSLTGRLEANNSGLVLHNSDTYTHIVSDNRSYNTAQGNFSKESNSSDVIDLSRRNLTSLTTMWQNNKINSALDVLDLSGSEKRQQERHSVIKSVGSATVNKSTVKDVADDKDSSPAWSCPICFESLLSGQSVSSTPCGHVFCTKCIEEAVNQFKKCPTCCRKVVLKRVHKIFL